MTSGAVVRGAYGVYPLRDTQTDARPNWTERPKRETLTEVKKGPNPSEQDLTRQFWQAPFWDNLMFAFRAVDHCVERHPLIFCATIAKQTDCCG
jgi:hypothetical protein